MKIVILEGYAVNPGDLSWERLEQLGDVTVYDRTSLIDEQEAIERIGEAEVVFINKTPITQKIIDASPKLKMISLLATGYNVVDIDYAKKRGIVVTNVPTYGTDSVGQFTIAMLLEICHRIGHHDREVKQGRWAKSPDWTFMDYPMIELAGKTMGIIGFGRIGQRTGQIAQALGMRVLAFNRSQSDAGRAIADYVDLDSLLTESDVISLHSPLTPETNQIINRDSIAKMKDGVIILNTSRGPLIQEQDLADALNSGKVYAAGLDVVAVEPIQADNPLLQARNTIITPHIAWAPKESRQRIIEAAEANLNAFLAGQPIHVVNP